MRLKHTNVYKIRQQSMLYLGLSKEWLCPSQWHPKTWVRGEDNGNLRVKASYSQCEYECGHFRARQFASLHLEVPLAQVL